MFLRVERGSSTPISRQIDAQIRAQILAGKLRPGDQLPAVRQLARELAVNVNTVLRVYERLGAEGLLDLRHGDGTYVAARRKADAGRLEDDRRELALELDALARRALLLGVSSAQLQRLLADALRRAQREVSVSSAPA